MSYDPNFPPHNAELESEPFRNQFNALKALIDAQGVQIASLLSAVAQLQAAQTPVGGVIPWMKDLPGMPALPANFVECNGGTVSDPDSPINGAPIPDINTGSQRFVRGGLTSGQLGGIDYFATASADFSSSGPAQNFVTTDFSPGAVPLPPYVTAVMVMRIK